MYNWQSVSTSFLELRYLWSQTLTKSSVKVTPLVDRKMYIFAKGVIDNYSQCTQEGMGEKYTT